MNLCLGAWTKPSIPQGDEAIEVLTQLPLTSGSTNNALIALIMDEYFFLYHYYYRQLIEKWDDERIVSWAQNYKHILKKSKQKDDKLYDADLFEKAYSENLNTTDGYVTALIPTIEKRYAYVKGLSLDQKFSNKIKQVELRRDSVFILLSPEVKNEHVVVEYLDSEKKLKILKALPLTKGMKGYYCVLPQKAVSYYVYTIFNGIKYSYPYNGLLGPLDAQSLSKVALGLPKE